MSLQLIRGLILFYGSEVSIPDRDLMSLQLKDVPYKAAQYQFQSLIGI